MERFHYNLKVESFCRFIFDVLCEITAGAEIVKISSSVLTKCVILYHTIYLQLQKVCICYLLKVSFVNAKSEIAHGSY